MKKLLLALSLCTSLSAPFVSCTKDVALVLGGGGAKGAYQVGCYKALSEYGLDQRISVMSGTSVGALNAALFSCNSVEEAEEIWRTRVDYDAFLALDEASLFDFGINTVANAVDGILSADIENMNFAEALGMGLYGMFKGAVDSAVEYFSGDKHQRGLFDRAPLEGIIADCISIEKIRESGIDVYATCVEKSSLMDKMNAERSEHAKYFLLNEQPGDKEISDILLASSAIPGVYPSQTIPASAVYEGYVLGKDAEYIDGGSEIFGGDNTPLYTALSKKGLKTVIIIQLDSAAQKMELENYRIVNLIPSEDLGDAFEGTLNFSNEKINHLIELGYQDTIRTLEEAGFSKPKKNLISLLAK